MFKWFRRPKSKLFLAAEEAILYGPAETDFFSTVFKVCGHDLKFMAINSSMTAESARPFTAHEVKLLQKAVVTRYWNDRKQKDRDREESGRRLRAELEAKLGGGENV